MTENVKKFMELVSADGEEAVQKMNKASQEELIAMAAEMGITLTKEDFKLQSCELSDDEVEAAAGGAVCACAVGGGGAGSNERDDACVCVIGGLGYGASPEEVHRSGGVMRIDNIGQTVKEGERTERCFCMTGGGGKSFD